MTFDPDDRFELEIEEHFARIEEYDLELALRDRARERSDERSARARLYRRRTDSHVTPLGCADSPTKEAAAPRATAER